MFFLNAPTKLQQINYYYLKIRHSETLKESNTLKFIAKFRHSENMGAIYAKDTSGFGYRKKYTVVTKGMPIDSRTGGSKA